MMFYDKLTPRHIEMAQGYIKEIESEGANRKEALRDLKSLYYKYVDKEANKGKIMDMTCKECSTAIVEHWKWQIDSNMSMLRMKKQTNAK